jgi:hypothetical protein
VNSRQPTVSKLRQIKQLLITKNALTAVCIIISIVFSMLMLTRGEDPHLNTFSSIGEANRVLFAFWGVATAAAVYLNLQLLATRLKIKHRLFQILLAIGCSMAVVTVAVVGDDTTRRVIHVGSALIFGVTCVLALLFLMIIKAKQKSKRSSVPYITAMAIVGVIFIWTSIYVGWFTAHTQVLLTNMCLIVMFCSNFFEKWQIDQPEEQPKQE